MVDLTKLISRNGSPGDGDESSSRTGGSGALSTVPGQPPLFRNSDPIGGTAPGWQWHRDRLRRRLLQEAIEGISQDEIGAHFDGMPARYWDRISESELIWGLQTVHRFLTGLVATESGETAVAMDWRHFPRQDITKFLVCTWDRQGLLSKLAGYISALRLSVVRAEVYTRADNIVLDVFWLCDGARRHIGDPERLRQLAFLLEGGLAEPPRFASAWAVDSHKLFPRRSTVPTRVTFNNVDSPQHTIVTVEASERLGLLRDMLQIFYEHELNISEALIDTIDNVARDVFFVTDPHKGQIVDPRRLAAFESAMVKALDLPG
jgi:[protein-PII] uridylyltransferase